MGHITVICVVYSKIKIYTIFVCDAICIFMKVLLLLNLLTLLCVRMQKYDGHRLCNFTIIKGATNSWKSYINLIDAVKLHIFCYPIVYLIKNKYCLIKKQQQQNTHHVVISSHFNCYCPTENGKFQIMCTNKRYLF